MCAAFNPFALLAPDSFGVTAIHIQSKCRPLLEPIADYGDKHAHPQANGETMFVVSIKPDNFLAVMGAMIQARVFFKDFRITKRGKNILVELFPEMGELSFSEVQELENIVRSESKKLPLEYRGKEEKKE